MLKKLILILFLPLGVLGAVSETDVSGSDVDSPVGSPVARRRASKQATPQNPFERRQAKVSSALSKLKIGDDESAKSIHQCFLTIPDTLFDKVEAGIILFAANLRKLTKTHYDRALESFIEALSEIWIRFQERPKIVESVLYKSAIQFSDKLDLRKDGASSPKKVTRSVKQEVILPEFFPKLLTEVTRSILEKDQTIPGKSSQSWTETFANAYEEKIRERVLAGACEVIAADRPWYEHMTAITPKPDFKFFELLQTCSDRSRSWVRRMVNLYSSDRLPLNSLKMTKYFLGIPEEFQGHVAKVLETFFDENFEKRKDSQVRIVNLFMQQPVGRQTYISYFVNIIGFVKINVELAEIFLQKLTSPGWAHVEAEIRRSKDNQDFELTNAQLEILFKDGLQEAARTISV